MLEKGLVIKNNEDGIQVQMQPAGECGSCNACFHDNNKSHILLFQEKMNIKPGNIVEVEVNPRYALKSAFLLFLFPILMLFTGYYLSINLITIPELPLEYQGILGGIFLLILTYITVYLYDRYTQKSNKKKQIRIVRVIS
jgi:sigma-E factor negative regulatory protein RseC